jgi:hypothetical protein
LISAVTDGAGPTFTTTLSVAVPPGPEQFAVYVVELVRFPVDHDPDVPVNPPGEIVQLVAFVETRASVAAVL